MKTVCSVVRSVKDYVPNDFITTKLRLYNNFKFPTTERTKNQIKVKKINLSLNININMNSLLNTKQYK